MNATTAPRAQLGKYAWLSIAAALATIGLKLAAYLLTDSVGLLSDALESGVNLVGGIMALAMLTIAARPPDDEHSFGHSKAEYFSSGTEGTLILIAALSIAATAIERLLHPKPIEQIGLGLGVSVGASLINLAVALVLLKAARQNHSITLESNAKHLLTDVWTSAGVVVGVGAVAVTGWNPLDPMVALVVAANIVWTGVGIVRRSVQGLMDTALPTAELDQIRAVLERFVVEGVRYHALRTRAAGASRFVSVHVLVPGTWSVYDGHQLLNRIEAEIKRTLPNTTVLTHLEPQEDETAWEAPTEL